MLSLLAIALVVGVTRCSLNPLRKSDEQIRESILKLTPIGMSKEDVIKVIKDNEQWYKNYPYSDKYQHFDHGYLRDDVYGPVIYYDDIPHNKTDIVGKETIMATIGQYSGPLPTAVFACWAFDENSNLVDVAITREEYEYF